jgi:hypothetical protein
MGDDRTKTPETGFYGSGDGKSWTVGFAPLLIDTPADDGNMLNVLSYERVYGHHHEYVMRLQAIMHMPCFECSRKTRYNMPVRDLEKDVFYSEAFWEGPHVPTVSVPKVWHIQCFQSAILTYVGETRYEHKTEYEVYDVKGYIKVYNK